MLGKGTSHTALSLALEYVELPDMIRLGPQASIPRILSQHEIVAFSGWKRHNFLHVALFAKAPDLAIGMWRC